MTNMRKKIPIITIIVLLIVTFIGSLLIILNTNQSVDKSLSIDNFNELYYNVDQKTTDDISTLLYNTVAKNLNNATPPQNGATIRTTAPYLYQYYKNSGLYRGDFIVDIPDIQQSYRITFFQDDGTKRTNVGYRMLVSCLTKSPKIYPDFDCKDLNPDGITEDQL